MGGWQDTPGELQTPVNYEMLHIVIPETFVVLYIYICDGALVIIVYISNYVFTLVFCISSGSSAEYELQEGPLPEVTFIKVCHFTILLLPCL